MRVEGVGSGVQGLGARVERVRTRRWMNSLPWLQNSSPSSSSSPPSSTTCPPHQPHTSARVQVRPTPAQITGRRGGRACPVSGAPLSGQALKAFEFVCGGAWRLQVPFRNESNVRSAEAAVPAEHRQAEPHIEAHTSAHLLIFGVTTPFIRISPRFLPLVEENHDKGLTPIGICGPRQRAFANNSGAAQMGRAQGGCRGLTTEDLFGGLRTGGCGNGPWARVSRPGWPRRP